MPGQAGIGWLLVVMGLLVAAAGLLWMLIPSIPWLGRLPGSDTV